MDNKKAQGVSSTSFTSQLFGPQQSSSNDVFGSIFSLPKGVGQNCNYGGSSGTWLNNHTGTVNQPSNSNTTQDNTYRPRYASAGCKERNSIYHQGAEPCYMSSSLYYGGQETYSQSNTQSTSTSYPTFKKGGGEDDSSISARGDWWQGSLYY